MNFVQTFELLCSEKGKSPTAVGNELGIAKSSISYWRNGTVTPSYSSITAIAEYFNVSTDYLLGKTKIKNPPNKQSSEDIAKVALFGNEKEVTPEMWQEVEDYVEYIKQKYNK